MSFEIPSLTGAGFFASNLAQRRPGARAASVSSLASLSPGTPPALRATLAPDPCAPCLAIAIETNPKEGAP